MEELNAELRKLSDQMHQKQKWMHHLKTIQVSLDRDSTHLKKLEFVLADEKNDFEKFEGKSLIGWIYNLFGRREEQMEKERVEYLKAQLLYDQYNSLVQHLEEKKTDYLYKLSRVEGIETDYQTALNKKELFLIKNNTPYLKILTDLASKEDHLSRRIQDKKDALEKAKPVIIQLKKIQKELEKAIEWAKKDIKGRKHSERYKYRAVDKIIFYLPLLNKLITNLNIELEDENQSVNGRIKMPVFDRFTDSFSGSFGYDTEVLKKLEGVEAVYLSVLKEVNSIINNLQKNISSFQQDLKETIRKRVEIIELAD